MHDQHRLLLLALDRHKAHVRSPDRLADRLGIVRVVLAALAVGDHELRCHELYRVPQLGELAAPIVSAATRFDADQARRQLRKELQHLRPGQLLAHPRLAAFIHPVHMEDLLRDIQPDSCNLHLDSPCSAIERTTVFQSGTTDAVRAGGVHVIKADPPIWPAVRARLSRMDIRFARTVDRTGIDCAFAGLYRRKLNQYIPIQF